MQTKEVAPRAQSTGLEGSLTDTLPFQHPLHHKIPALVHMAVKQEPQEEDERGRETNILGPQLETPLSGDASHVHQGNQQVHDVSAGQLPQDNSNRARPSRGRRKSRWKLKFHHQALPPEYLDHYEAALAQEALNSSPASVSETSPSPAPTTSTSTPSPISDVHGWLQRIAAMQQELCPPLPTSPQPNNTFGSGRRSVITSAPQPYLNQSQPSPRPPMKYSDLPYMGEITLDNSKPRRGRKPKKADICHLIYKNYGTILPGTPGRDEMKTPRDKLDKESHIPFQRTDIQNRISSLLEKRLTQESRRSLGLDSLKEQDEPLNLCIRDLNQLKIRLLRKHGNVYESGQLKSEASSDNEDIECLNASYDSIQQETVNNNNINLTNNNNNHDPTSPNPGFVYWPNAGVFIHPMALQSQFLYYQKMAQNEKNLPKPDTSPKEQKIVPKSLYSMLENNSLNSPTPVPPVPSPSTPTLTPTSTPSPVSPRPKRNAPLGNQGQPTKRKRSAIFIPPMPTENNNNPTTEVSICKFKFTGGAKPSLQEKKSLSVDAGGNFRYYSGTGDKSMRGYEFFPREALQQPAGQAGSSTGAFLNAAAERITTPTCPRSPIQDDGRRKRKTRKSIQREKLEQTFKEKGFLIQTQQLESAEGATYCKFRQLRKFTRYLFRSWKDYLPGNVRELTGGPEDIHDADESDPASTSSPSPHPSLVDIPSGLLEEPRTLSS
ncbi:uncharacterized protein LOC122498451 isoform X2 [Leptopilina heterotoma]|nr:uncharacterized protein LOC122498451 isoform X2 [Leptopilina heterotoma]XP_043462108.1 uncharacterized protein LOC122498451 isoform X2 [Leptopilina heterotoma]